MLFLKTAKHLRFAVRSLQQDVNNLKLPVPIKVSFLKNEPRILDHNSNSILIYHGLFGNKINWRSLSKTIAEKTKRIVYALDCRDHGESEKSNQLTYLAMAADTLNFMDVRALDKVTLIGHSLGGRAIMQFAFLFPERIEKLVIIDIGLERSPPSSKFLITYAKQMKQALLTLSPTTSLSEGRKQIGEFLEPSVPVSLS